MSTPHVLLLLLVVAEHLGKLHPFEQLLVVVVAFGPFLVLGFVVRAARRRAIEQEAEEEAEEEADR
jgi:hypothetical protein